VNIFYSPNITDASSEIVFDKEESRHIVKALRKQTGDVLHLTNGKGSIFKAAILSTDPKRCLAQVISAEQHAPLPYHLHIAVAPTKLNDRFEWFLEKAAEIGVSEITPLICEHSERKIVKHERYQKIIVSAMKQSLKAHLPKLNEAILFNDFIASTPNTDIKCIAHCEEIDKKLLKNVLMPKADVLVLIGPEGDFSNSEIASAIATGFTPVSLGTSRLRTETAAIVACHSVAFINEN